MRGSLDVFTRYLGAQSLPPVTAPSVHKPAVTISRQAGAGAVTAAQLVVEQLDKECPGEPQRPLAVFDRNLAAKILEDHNRC